MQKDMGERVSKHSLHWKLTATRHSSGRSQLCCYANIFVHNCRQIIIIIRWIMKGNTFCLRQLKQTFSNITAVPLLQHNSHLNNQNLSNKKQSSKNHSSCIIESHNKSKQLKGWWFQTPLTSTCFKVLVNVETESRKSSMLSEVRTPLFNLLQIETNRMAKKFRWHWTTSMSIMNVHSGNIFHAPMMLLVSTPYAKFPRWDFKTPLKLKICEFDMCFGTLVQSTIIQDWIKTSPKFSIDCLPKVRLATFWHFHIQMTSWIVSTGILKSPRNKQWLRNQVQNILNWILRPPLY